MNGGGGFLGSILRGIGRGVVGGVQGLGRAGAGFLGAIERGMVVPGELSGYTGRGGMPEDLVSRYAPGRTEVAVKTTRPLSGPATTGKGVRGSFKVTAEDLRPHLGSGLQAHAQDFVDAGTTYNLDPRFLAAVSKVETGDGTSNAFRNKGNAMGISDAKGPVNIGDVRTSIFRQAATLARENGPYAGANTIEAIGAIYAPPGAGNDPHGTNGTWPGQVNRYYRQMTGG